MYRIGLPDMSAKDRSTCWAFAWEATGPAISVAGALAGAVSGAEGAVGSVQGAADAACSAGTAGAGGAEGAASTGGAGASGTAGIAGAADVGGAAGAVGMEAASPPFTSAGSCNLATLASKMGAESTGLFGLHGELSAPQGAKARLKVIGDVTPQCP